MRETIAAMENAVVVRIREDGRIGGSRIALAKAYLPLLNVHGRPVEGINGETYIEEAQ